MSARHRGKVTGKRHGREDSDGTASSGEDEPEVRSNKRVKRKNKTDTTEEESEPAVEALRTELSQLRERATTAEERATNAENNLERALTEAKDLAKAIESVPDEKSGSAQCRRCGMTVSSSVAYRCPGQLHLPKARDRYIDRYTDLLLPLPLPSLPRVAVDRISPSEIVRRLHRGPAICYKCLNETAAARYRTCWASPAIPCPFEPGCPVQVPRVLAESLVDLSVRYPAPSEVIQSGTVDLPPAPRLSGPAFSLMGKPFQVSSAPMCSLAAIAFSRMNQRKRMATDSSPNTHMSDGYAVQCPVCHLCSYVARVRVKLPFHKCLGCSTTFCTGCRAKIEPSALVFLAALSKTDAEWLTAPVTATTPSWYRGLKQLTIGQVVCVRRADGQTNATELVGVVVNCNKASVILDVIRTVQGQPVSSLTVNRSNAVFETRLATREDLLHDDVPGAKVVRTIDTNKSILIGAGRQLGSFQLCPALDLDKTSPTVGWTGFSRVVKVAHVVSVGRLKASGLASSSSPANSPRANMPPPQKRSSSSSSSSSLSSSSLSSSSAASATSLPLPSPSQPPSPSDSPPTPVSSTSVVSPSQSTPSPTATSATTAPNNSSASSSSSTSSSSAPSPTPPASSGTGPTVRPSSTTAPPPSSSSSSSSSGVSLATSASPSPAPTPTPPPSRSASSSSSSTATVLTSVAKSSAEARSSAEAKSSADGKKSDESKSGTAQGASASVMVDKLTNCARVLHEHCFPLVWHSALFAAHRNCVDWRHLQRVSITVAELGGIGASYTEEDIAAHTFIVDEVIRQALPTCPGCGVISTAEKKDTSTHMTCPQANCGAQWCYCCGGQFFASISDYKDALDGKLPIRPNKIAGLWTHPRYSAHCFKFRPPGTEGTASYDFSLHTAGFGWDGTGESWNLRSLHCANEQKCPPTLDANTTFRVLEQYKSCTSGSKSAATERKVLAGIMQGTYDPPNENVGTAAQLQHRMNGVRITSALYALKKSKQINACALMSGLAHSTLLTEASEFHCFAGAFERVKRAFEVGVRPPPIRNTDADKPINL